MQIFCATFRIHEDAGYKERYESTIAAIKRCCHGQYWDQPTSYFLFENPHVEEVIRRGSPSLIGLPFLNCATFNERQRKFHCV
jgi:hypothetical protein